MQRLPLFASACRPPLFWADRGDPIVDPETGTFADPNHGHLFSQGAAKICLRCAKPLDVLVREGQAAMVVAEDGIPELAPPQVWCNPRPIRRHHHGPTHRRPTPQEIETAIGVAP